jgi:hypothetical protein
MRQLAVVELKHAARQAHILLRCCRVLVRTKVNVGFVNLHECLGERSALFTYMSVCDHDQVPGVFVSMLHVWLFYQVVVKMPCLVAGFSCSRQGGLDLIAPSTPEWMNQHATLRSAASSPIASSTGQQYLQLIPYAPRCFSLSFPTPIPGS